MIDIALIINIALGVILASVVCGLVLLWGQDS